MLATSKLPTVCRAAQQITYSLNKNVDHGRLRNVLPFFLVIASPYSWPRASNTMSAGGGQGTPHGVQHGVVQPELSERALRRLAVGNTFESWIDLRKVIVDHGIASERVIVSAKKDTKRLLAKCRMHMADGLDKRCNWSLPAIVRASAKTITITQTNLVHRCEFADHCFRRMHSNSNRLAESYYGHYHQEQGHKSIFVGRNAVPDTPRYPIPHSHAAKKRYTTRLDGSDS